MNAVASPIIVPTLRAECLQELLDAYGLGSESQRIVEALPYVAADLQLVDVLNVMARMGYNGKPLKARMNDIDARLLPCLFVLKKTGEMRVMITSETTSKARGTAYVFTKQHVKQPQEEKEAALSAGHGWFRSALNRFGALFWKVGCISFMLNLVALALPLFMMVIYDRVTDIASAHTLYAMGAGATLLLAIEWTLRRLRSRHLAWFAARLDNMVSNRVLSRLLQLPAHAIERASVAAQVSRLKAFESVREFFTGPLFLTLLDVPFTLISLLLLIYIGGVLAWVPVVVAAIYACLIMAFRPRTRLLMFFAARARSTLHTHHIELFDKIESLKLNGMSEVWKEQFRDLSAASALSSLQAQHLAHMLETLAHAIAMLAGVAVIYAGVEHVWSGALSGGALFASILLTWRVMGPLQTVCTSVSRLEQLYRSIQQIDVLMNLDTEREQAASLAKISTTHGAISFAKIGLRYTRESDPVFAGLSFEAQPGEIIAIAGGNGSGKSTILKLVLGLYRPQAGAIYLDGRDIRQLDPIDLRKTIAYIPQNPEIFEGSIAENIRFGNAFASDAAIREALDLADATHEIDAMPHGILTQAAQNGQALPSSLAYRINLARAYVKDSPILLIDELPYAILNSNTGDRFIEQLKAWRGKKTIFLVSHRDDHIRIADRAIGLLSVAELRWVRPMA
jgi:ATP-binding cassette, subfamily C, bacterial LapB